jgi:hypothetical protein
MSVAGYTELVYVRTDTTTVGTGDKIDGVQEFDYSRSAGLEETTDFKDGSGYKTRIQTLKDSSISISGQTEMSDTIQGILRTAYGSGATVYVTIKTDPTASAGSQGDRVPCLVESYDFKGSVSGVGEFSVKLVGNGAPVAI